MVKSKSTRQKKYTPHIPRSESTFEVSSQSDFSSKYTKDSVKKESDKRYKRIRSGLRRAIPAAIVMWAFHKLPANNGLTSRRIINFIKKHYRVIDNPGKTGKSIGALLRCAVEFGLVHKRGNRYFPAKKLVMKH